MMARSNNYFVSFLFVILLSYSVSAVLLSDQGSDVRQSSTGSILSLGNLTIEVWNNASGGTIIYNTTFTNAIVNGSWNKQISLSLDFGKSYWKNYRINGEDISFDGSDRLEFHAPIGYINNISFINFSLVGSCPAGFAFVALQQNGSPTCQSFSSSNFSLTGGGTFLYNDSTSVYVNESRLNNTIRSTELSNLSGVLSSFRINKTSGTFYSGILLDSIIDSLAIWAYNETLASNTSLISAYGRWFYNQTAASSSSSFNQTYSDYSYNQTTASNSTIVQSYSRWFYNQSDGTGTGNSSWNESRANSLYSLIIWSYNQTTASNTSLISAYGRWFYNQTYGGSTFNQSYADYSYNHTLASNSTIVQPYSRWFYNHTSASNSTIVQSYSRWFYNQSDGTGTGNSSWNESYAGTLYSRVIWDYNETVAANSSLVNTYGRWFYNQTYGGSTFNQSYADYSYNHTSVSNSYTDSQVSSVNSSSNVAKLLVNNNLHLGSGSLFVNNTLFIKTNQTICVDSLCIANITINDTMWTWN
jgi:hypothetical protein